MLEMENKTKD